MRRLFCTLALCSILLSANAQTKIAIKAGANYSTAKVYQYDVKQPNQFNAGFGFGILFKAPFDGALHFSPYIQYNLKGYQYKTVRGADSIYNNHIHYIDIVPALSVDFPIGKNKNTLVLSAGPHVSIAIAGTEKITTAGISSSKKMKFSTEAEYGIADLGISTSLGYHMKHFFTELGFQLGLANINNNGDLDKRNIQNRVLSINFGYYLK